MFDRIRQGQMNQQLTIDRSTLGDHTILDIAGEIDLATAPQFEEHVAGVDVGSALVVDMSNVTFMDSTGLRVLIAAHERAEENGGRLAIVAAEGPVTKLLGITGVTEWLNVYTTRALATADG